jgi:hypothetical protein
MYVMGTKVTITGQPIMTLTFFDLPTLNRLKNMHRKTRAGVTQKLRFEGWLMAYDFKMKCSKALREKLMTNRALLLVKVMPPKEEISDIYNVSVKEVSDGFTDAEVWADDEWAHVPLVIFMFAGIDQDVQWRKKRGTNRRRARMRRTIIEVHELDTLHINGERQILPKGRTRL